MKRRFSFGFLATLVAFLALNLLMAHLQSDCGIRAVIGLWLPSFRFCADDITRVGFPLRVIERGGFAFRSIFDEGALVADILIALATSVAVGWVASKWNLTKSQVILPPTKPDESPKDYLPSTLPPPQHFSRAQILRVAASQLFGEIDDAAFDAIQTEFEFTQLPAGEALFQEGDPGDSIYVVISGRLHAIRERPSGVELVGEIGRGEIVGEVAMLTEETRTATIRAARDSELAKLSKAAFDRFVEKNPESMRRVARLVAQRLRETIRAPRITHKLSAFAIVPVSEDIALVDFSERLARHLEKFGTVLHLNAAGVNRALGRDIAQDDITHWDATDSQIVAWLTEQEAQHRFILYHADAHWSPWTRRCVRQADCILLVADGDAPMRLNDIARELVALAPRPVSRELILLHRARMLKPGNTTMWLNPLNVEMHHHLDPGSETDVARLARRLTGNSIGLVLSGGGARGFTHIGVIRAMQELGIPIDMIGGVSMGSIVSGLYALGMDEIEMRKQLRRGWIKMKPLTDYTLPFVSLLSAKRISKWLTQVFGETQIEDLWTNYFCVSSSLAHARVVVHRRGSLRRGIRASMSVPGIVPPLPDRGDLLVDGGQLNNLPADVMREFCDGKVIAVNVNPTRAPDPLATNYGENLTAGRLIWNRINPWSTKIIVPNIQQIIERGSMLITYVQATEYERGAVDLYLHPPTEDFDFFGFTEMDRIIEVGYAYARERLQAWKESLPG